MPHPDSILRRQCLRILTGSTLAITTGKAFANLPNATFQISVPNQKLSIQGTQDWPSFLGPQRNGISEQPIKNRDWTDGNLKLLWQHELGDGYAIGSLESGLFIQPHLNKKSEVLDCLDSDTGKLIWRQNRNSEYRDLYGYDSGPRCSPIIHDQTIYHYGVDGVLTARDLKLGELKWQRDLNKDFGVIQNFFGVGSTPIVFEDKLIVMVGGSPEESKRVAPGALDQVTANGSAVVALDLQTGKDVYKVGNDLASYSSPIIAKMDVHDVGLAFCRSGLIGFDPTSGKELFSFAHRSAKLESVNAATPIVHGNQILLSETYSVGSVLLEIDTDRWTPKVVWQDDPNSREQSLLAHWNTPILHDDFLYASSGRHTGNAELRCVEWKTGKVRWSQPGLGRCSLTLAKDSLVVLGERGELFLMEANPDEFKMITQHSFSAETPALRYPAWAAPIVAGGKMFVRDVHRLFCFEI